MDWEPRVGMKVVCVDADDHGRFDTCPLFKYSGGLDGLTYGQTYTIRAYGYDIEDGQPAIWVEEIRRSLLRNYETGFAPARFKPLRERKTDISIFTALLTKAPTPEKEPA